MLSVQTITQLDLLKYGENNDDGVKSKFNLTYYFHISLY